MIFRTVYGDSDGADGQGSTTEGMDALRILRGGRFFRLLRLLRLLRVAKIKKIAASMLELIADFAEWVGLLITIAQLQIFFLIFIHFLTCIWHVLGSSEELERTWRIDFVENGQGQFDDSVFNRYLISAQWALSTMTPNSTEIKAQNQRERFVWCSAQDH